MAILLLIPVGAAEWGGRGFYEPDTGRDRQSGMMFEEANTQSVARQVYFSAYISNSYTGGNPNVAGSNFVPFPTQFNAFLGVWKDCNGDDYIGVYEGALLEYRSELLLDPSICPAGQTEHNDGKWVQEFLWIGPDHPLLCDDGVSAATDKDNDTNPYNIHDGCARIWGDIGLPEDAGSLTCPVIPLPRGTVQSTGGVVRYVDCIVNYQIHDASVALDDAVPEEEADVQLGFGDADKQNPQNSESVFNQKNPYGDPAGDPAVSVFDCTGEHTAVQDPTGGDLRRVTVNDDLGLIPASVADPTGIFGDEEDNVALKNEDGSLVGINGTDDDGRVVTLHANGVSSVNPQGSPAATVNDTLEGTPNVGGGQVETALVSAGLFRVDLPLLNPIDADDDADCDRENGFGENGDPYRLVETDFEPSSSMRSDHDFYFTFYEDTRGSERGTPHGNALAGALGPATPSDLGVGLDREWTGDPIWVGSPGMLVSRNGFISTDDYSPKGVQYFTFYASVSPSAITEHSLALANGGVTSTYGSDHCDGTTPLTGAWQCDPALWWVDSTGADIANDWQIRVGQPYNLFDVDCYDETYVRGQSTTYTTVSAGETCVR